MERGHKTSGTSLRLRCCRMSDLPFLLVVVLPFLGALLVSLSKTRGR